MPVCTSSKMRSRPCSSQSARSSRRNGPGTRRTPPSPWIGSIRIAAGLRTDRRLDRLEVAERRPGRSLGDRAEAFEIFRVAGGGERRQRAAVEGAGEGDDPDPLGLAVDEMVAARRLDGALDRLGAGIGEEDLVGKGRAAPGARPAAPGRGCGRGSRCARACSACSVSAATSAGWAWPSDVDGDAAREVEHAPAVGGRSSQRPRPARRRSARAQKYQRAVSGPCCRLAFRQAHENQKAPPVGSTFATYIIAPRRAVSISRPPPASPLPP